MFLERSPVAHEKQHESLSGSAPIKYIHEFLSGLAQVQWPQPKYIGSTLVDAKLISQILKSLTYVYECTKAHPSSKKMSSEDSFDGSLD
jgi:hypothetical protein